MNPQKEIEAVTQICQKNSVDPAPWLELLKACDVYKESIEENSKGEPRYYGV